MLDHLTGRQLTDWLAWLRKYHPFPNRNDNFFAMLLASWSERGKPQDFLIYDRPEDRFADDDITSEQLASQIHSLIPRSPQPAERMPMIQGEKRQ